MAKKKDQPTLADLLGAYITAQCSVLIDAETPLRSGDDVIHPTRVAVRRLRSTIRVFGDVVDVAQAGALEDELVWWAGLLGAVRDADVMTTRLLGLIESLPPQDVLGPVARKIQVELGVRRKAAMDEVTAALSNERHQALITQLHHWRNDPPFTEAAQVPATKAKRYVKRADATVEKRLTAAVAAVRDEAGDAAHTEELFHRARKAGKRHRYAVEAAAPVIGAKAEKVIEARKELQDVLGDHQDAMVSAAFLRSLGGQVGISANQNGFTYGLLYQRELSSTSRLVADLEALG